MGFKLARHFKVSARQKKLFVVTNDCYLLDYLLCGSAEVLALQPCKQLDVPLKGKRIFLPQSSQPVSVREQQVLCSLYASVALCKLCANYAE